MNRLNQFIQPSSKITEEALNVLGQIHLLHPYIVMAFPLHYLLLLIALTTCYNMTLEVESFYNL